MIKITLKNFRKFSNNEFTFDKSLSLISGNSGKGKTTIFMAIIFALSGEGKKLISYGKTSCSVTLKIDTVTIFRSKRPNRLVVTTSDGKASEDKIAQAVIDKLFPHYEFGYMSQRVDRTFISMSSTDKMRFIRNMALGHEDVDTLHTNCKNLVKARKDALTIATNQREATEKTLNDVNIEKVEHLEEKTFDTTSHELQKRLKLYCDQRTSVQNAIAIRDRLLSEIALSEIDGERGDVEAEIYKLQAAEIKWGHYKKEQDKLSKLKPSGIPRQELDSMIDDMRTLTQLGRELKQLDALRADLETLEEELRQTAVTLRCPHCEKDLALRFDGKNTYLDPTAAKPRACQKELEYEKVRSLEKQKSNLTLRIHQFEEKAALLHSIKAQYDGLHDDDVNGQLKLLLETRKNDDAFQRQSALCKQLATDRPSHSSEYLDHLKKDRERQFALLEKKSQLDKISKVITNDDFESKINTTETLLAEIGSYEKQVDAYKHWSKVSELKTKEDELNESFPRSVKLQSIIKRAERMAIEQIIEKINVHAQLYIDNFLDNMTVSLVFDKSGVENNKLSVAVFHDGHESDLSSISGGEFSRVVLAFTIALAEINNVKLLLLDECVASLDQDTTTTVIDTIRKNFNGSIICIAHQTTTGVFDFVMDLNQF
jgi:exonuclease SbcC